MYIYNIYCKTCIADAVRSSDFFGEVEGDHEAVRRRDMNARIEIKGRLFLDSVVAHGKSTRNTYVYFLYSTVLQTPTSLLIT